METRVDSRLRRALWIGVPALVLVVVAASAFPRALAWEHRRHAPPSSAGELAERLDHGLEHLLDKVDASDAQRERASAIAERRASELFGLLSEGRTLRHELKQVLLAEQLDKTRVEQTQARLDALAQRASAVGLASAFELAEVLTPAQRRELADRLSRFER